MPTLIATGMPQLLAHLVDGVVLRVVDRDLRRERRDAHRGEVRVLRVRRGCGARSSVGVLGSWTTPATRNRPGCAAAISSDFETSRSDRRREHAGCDVELVHHAEQLVDADTLAAVAAEIAGDVRVLGLTEEAAPPIRA